MTAAFLEYGAFILPRRMTDFVVSLILVVSVVPTCFAAEVFKCAPRSLACSMTGMVLPSLLHLCVLSHALSAASEVNVTDFVGASLAPISSRCSCVRLDAYSKFSRRLLPVAIICKSSARILATTAASLICMIQGRRIRATTIIEYGSPCGMLVGLWYAFPKPPATVLCT